MLPTAFDRWLEATIEREGPFTAFLILFQDEPGTIVPVASSYLHVIGPDVRWDEIVALIGSSGMDWQSVAVFAAKSSGGGPLADVDAQRRLVTLQQAVTRDRLTVKKGDLFDDQGRRLSLDVSTPARLSS